MRDPKSLHEINDPDTRLSAVYALAVEVYGEEDAEAFWDNLHGGGVAEKMGFRGDYICPEHLVRDGADGTKRVVNYLLERRNG